MIRAAPTPSWSEAALEALAGFAQAWTGGPDPVVRVHAEPAADGDVDLELQLVDRSSPSGEGEWHCEMDPIPVRWTAGTAPRLDGQEIHFGDVRGFRGFLVREAGSSGSRAPGPSSSSRSGDLPVMGDNAFTDSGATRQAAGVWDPAPIRKPSVETPEGPAELVAAVQRELDRRVNPLVDSHGGAVYLIRVRDDRVAEVEMTGGCQGCTAARGTLEEIVVRILRKAVPELAGVDDVTNHEAGTAPWLAPAPS